MDLNCLTAVAAGDGVAAAAAVVEGPSEGVTSRTQSCSCCSHLHC